MKIQLPPTILNFLDDLKENNTRDWMEANRARYLENEKLLKAFYYEIEQELNQVDEIEKVKVFRINRDVRFSKNKTPYNVHRSASFSRAGAHRRGSYYLRIEPHNNSRISGGFFSPEPADLKRIRQEFSLDAQEIRDILHTPNFKMHFKHGLDSTRSVKTAPRGFKKDDPNIDLIRLKSFFVTRTFTDDEVLSPNFGKQVVRSFKELRPFFDYMSEVLTTDLNGESIIQ